MNQENIQTDMEASDTVETVENSEPKLLKFDENNAVSSGRDINKKITSLDTDLEQLRAELSSISNSVEEGLDRLGDSDTDLTAKVSETYKRLGEIDNAYKSLLAISSRIDADIQTLNGDVSEVAQQSASGIKNLEQSTIAQSHELAQKNQQVASQVNQLVETSKLTRELLDQKIQSATESMLQIEKSVVAEIEALSSATKDKTLAIENSIDSNKAKILKLQSVDEAIIRRATTLEISSAELTATSQRMDASITQLEKNSEILFIGVSELKERADALDALTDKHGFLINGLQKASSEIADKLAALSYRESKHFNIASVGFLLLLLVTAVLYFLQQEQFGSLQQEQIASDVVTNNSLAELEDKIQRVNASIQDELKSEIASVQDQVQSVEGRLSQASPFSQIGNDNIMHGEQWILTLPKDNFSVQLAYVDNKEAMFEIAQRYNFYLKDSLSYFSVNDDVSTKTGTVKYVLLSGNYVTQQQAMMAVQQMPKYIDMQQPLVRKLDTIQNYIAR